MNARITLFRIVSSFVLLSSLLPSGFGQGILWQNTIGGSGDDILTTIAYTSDGGCILGGNSKSNISGDKTENNLGNWDYWVVKLNASGIIEWQNTIGGSGWDDLQAIQQTSDGGYILGGFSSSNVSGDKTENSLGGFDYWVIKLNSSGSIEWQNTIGGNGSDFLYSIQQTLDGGYILGGASNSSKSGDKNTNGFGQNDYWVVKISATGNIQWQNTIGGIGNDNLISVRQIAGGSYILGGYSDSVISGNKSEPNFGLMDYMVAKLSIGGVMLWQKTFGGSGGDYLSSIGEIPGGGFFVTGYSPSPVSGNKTLPSFGGNDYWVLKLDSNGALIWQKVFGGNSNLDFCQQGENASDGGFLIFGTSLSSISGNKTVPLKGLRDFWGLKIDNNGNEIWQLGLGGSLDDNAAQLAQAINGDIFFAGYSKSPVSGDKTEPNLGGQDYWVLRLQGPGVTTPEISISDPCSCLDNATTLNDGQFGETIQVIGPSGDTWTVVSATGLYDNTSPAPPATPTAIAPGTGLTEVSPGIYHLEGIHVDAQGYILEVTNGTDNLSISNTCYYPNPVLVGLEAGYCSDEDVLSITVSAQKGDGSGPAAAESVLFELIRQSDNTVVASQSGPGTSFSPSISNLDPGLYTLRAVFDATAGGPAHPGCQQAIEQALEIWTFDKLYGMTYIGGTANLGAIVKINPDGTGYEVVHSFDTEGTQPYGSLTRFGDKLYGMTNTGGAAGAGTIFEYDPVNDQFATLHSFTGGAGGQNPYGSLTVFNDKLYGMTHAGGIGIGVIFEFDPATSTFTKLVDFNFSNGRNPYGDLLVYGDKLYGLAPVGGAFNNGVLFEFDPALGSMTVVHHFENPNGKNPFGSLILWDGVLYGLTQRGGTSGEGTIFSYDPATDVHTVLVHLSVNTTGSQPSGSLMAADGKLYGMNPYLNGTTGCIFEYDLATASYSILYGFTGATGVSPIAALTFYEGDLLGLASNGGTFGQGTIFRYDLANSQFNLLHTFGGVPDAGLPRYTALTRFSACDCATITFTATPLAETCPDSNDGVIEITNVAGGTEPYEYSIDSGVSYQPDALFSGLSDGTYQVMVKDANGCETQAIPVEVAPGTNADITFTATPMAETCPEANDGAIEITNVAGGTGPYEYSIDNGVSYQSDALFSGLPDGTYLVMVQDVNGCETQAVSIEVAAGTDTEAPAVHFCPSDMTLNAGNACRVLLSYPLPTFDDNCLGLEVPGILISGPASDSYISASLSPYTVVYQLNDIPGNGPAICNFTVTVEDNTPPVITGCPEDFSVECEFLVPDYAEVLDIEENCWGEIEGKFSAGLNHILLIKEDGTLWAWGRNLEGQLGDGTTINRNSPVQIGTDTDWKAIAAGVFHSLAIKEDGTLWAWGRNDYGQLGDWTNTSKFSPVQIGAGNDWSAVSAGIYHSVALKEDGTLWAWGWNNFGQLGDGTNTDKNSPVQVGVQTNWVALATRYYHVVALKSNGTLWAWGQNNYGQLGDGTSSNRNSPVQVGTANDWVDISVGTYHSMGLKGDGRIWAWGWNGLGQLGDGTGVNKNTPVQIGADDNWISVDAGGWHTTGLKSNGTLWTWGNNTFGQLGDGTNTNKLSPAQVGSETDWVAQAGAGYSSIGLRSDGKLWSWGTNSYGQLGIGSNSNTNSPTLINAIQLPASESIEVSQSPTPGTILTFGVHPVTVVAADLSGNTSECSFTITVEDNTPPVITGCPEDFSVECGFPVPDYVELLEIEENCPGGIEGKMDADIYHTLAVKGDGTLWAWGNNGNGQLGDGSNTPKKSPVQIGFESTWVTIAAGGYHSLGLKNDGTLWAWGANLNGQLGDGTNIDKNNPVQIGAESNWVSISAGSDHSLGIKNDGTLWAWGSNGFGQLGDGTFIYQYSPIQIGAENDWMAVSAGSFHSLALKADGTIWAWGRNNYGQLGGGSYPIENSPIQVGTGNDWSSISAGAEHSLARKNDGTLWAWGRNSYGQLGDGTTTNKFYPVQIGTNNYWESVVAGGHHSFGLKSDGTLWGWGLNQSGQLGDGTNISQSSPIQIGGGNDWAVSVLGGFHSFGMKNDGTLWAWGSNGLGQLGDGTDINKNSPILISSIEFEGSGIELTQSLSPGAFLSFGTHPITLTATDLSGNSSVCSFTVTVEDLTPPAITCPENLTVEACEYELPDFTLLFDEELTQTPSPGTYLNLGTHPVTLTYQYLECTSTVCTFLVTVEDMTPPAITCPENLMVEACEYVVPDYSGFIEVVESCESGFEGEFSGGLYHSIAITGDGALWAWGYNFFGQLGDGTNIDKVDPIQIGTASNWTDIKAGSFHSLGLKGDGTLWSWGRNSWGQLGHGTNLGDKNTPVQVGAENDWLDMAAGSDHSLGLRNDGTIWAWGQNLFGQLGLGNIYNSLDPIQIGTDNDWIAIEAGAYHSVGLKDDGTLWAWGYNNRGQLGDGTNINKDYPVQIGTDNDWIAIEAGAYHSVGLKDDGTLWAWGYNHRGQLGDGTNLNKNIPVQIGTESDWKSIFSGAYHSFGLRNDGSLWAWGLNASGQLGDGTNVDKNSPIQISIENEWLDISTGWFHSLGMKEDGFLRTWGLNNYGQLGDGTNIDKNSPVLINSVPLVETGGVEISQSPPPNTILTPGAHTITITATDASGNSSACSFTVTVQDNTAPTIACPEDLSVVACDYAIPDFSSQAIVSDNCAGLNPKQLAAGINHSLAVKTDGTLWSWGQNTFGQLGDGTFVSKNSPVQVGSDANWLVVSAGFGHSQGIRTDGTLWGWGLNNQAQVGDNTYINQSAPVQIGAATDWVAVSAGFEFSLALKSNGTLWGWGNNGNGQLGPGASNPQGVPIQIGTDSDWVAISTGFYHSAALKSDGTLWTWGYNLFGQLGNGSNSGSSVPAQVGSDTDWAWVSAGTYQTLAIKTDGTLWGWGNNSFGQLGIGSNTNQNVPVQAGTDTDWVWVDAGNYFSLGIKADGTLWAWGNNQHGQLGDGTTSHKYNPTQVGSDTDWSIAAAGDYFSLVARTNGAMWAWGKNDAGQLGLGNTTEQWTPVAIPGFSLGVEGVTISQSPTPGTILPAGVHSVTLTATDQAGNSNTCSFNLTVEGLQAAIPSAASDEFCSQGASGITVQLDANTDAFRVEAVVLEGIPTGFSAYQSNRQDGDLLEPANIGNSGSETAVIQYTITPYSYGPDGQNDDGGGDDCDGPVTTVQLNVLPAPSAADQETGICSGYALNVDLQNILNAYGNGLPGAFTWSAAANGDVTGETTDPVSANAIDDLLTLADPENGPQYVVYTVTPTGLNGCTGQPFTVTVEVAACEVTILDPCSCLDNATTLADGQFSETVEITGPAGDTWWVVAAPGLYQSASPEPPAPPLPVSPGTLFTEEEPGVYHLNARHIDASGYTITVTNGTAALSIGNTCYYPDPEISGLNALYCSKETLEASVTAQRGDGSGPASLENALFELIRQSDMSMISSQNSPAGVCSFDLNGLQPGAYILRATFDAGDDGTGHPGCTQTVEESFSIKAVNCGVFPWTGDE